MCCFYYYFHLVSSSQFLCWWQQREKAEVLGGLEERKPSWWRSVERTGRSYLSCSVYQPLLFQLLMTWCQSLSLKAPTMNSNKGLFLPSVLISSSPSRFFFISLFLEEERWASQKSMHSHATAASKIISLSLLCRIYFNMQYWVQLVCFSGWTIESPCGMLMSCILLLNIPLALYDMCVQQSRGSLVMGLARLAENMMGVLICQQVVLLNDGRADSPVECSSGWVGCGITVWAPPLLPQGSFSEWA